MQPRSQTSAEEIIDRLKLVAHPEGGYFKETYRCQEHIAGSALPERYGQSEHCFSTAIYFLVSANSCSRLHKVSSDEIFHYYLGDPLQMLLLHADGRAERKILGPHIGFGQEPQILIPKGTWQGSRLVDGGKFCLLGATVAPGFDWHDFEMAKRESLLALYPEEASEIERLTT